MDEEYFQRWESVCARQMAYGMEPRSDSKLTHLYCARVLPPCWTEEIVVAELLDVNDIHTLTPYGEHLEEVLRVLAAMARKQYRLPWGDTWEIVRFYGPPLFKLLCVSEMGGLRELRASEDREEATSSVEEGETMLEEREGGNGTGE